MEPKDAGLPSHAEMDMMADVIAGYHLPREPEQGIADMRARILFLTNQANSIETQMSLMPEVAESLGQLLTGIQYDLREARVHLLDYQAMQQQKN